MRVIARGGGSAHARMASSRASTRFIQPFRNFCCDGLPLDDALKEEPPASPRGFRRLLHRETRYAAGTDFL